MQGSKAGKKRDKNDFHYEGEGLVAPLDMFGQTKNEDKHEQPCCRGFARDAITTALYVAPEASAGLLVPAVITEGGRTYQADKLTLSSHTEYGSWR